MCHKIVGSAFFHCKTWGNYLPLACALPLKIHLHTEPLAPVDCVGSWGPWGPCSVTCNWGRWSKEYTVTGNAANGGRDCPHFHGETESEKCKDATCGMAVAWMSVCVSSFPHFPFILCCPHPSSPHTVCPAMSGEGGAYCPAIEEPYHCTVSCSRGYEYLAISPWCIWGSYMPATISCTGVQCHAG